MKNFDYLQRVKETEEKECPSSDNKNNSLSNAERAWLQLKSILNIERKNYEEKGK